ncbi:hypothetical protein B9Z55_025290 [Caenorhabditis nigoni]|uniref:Uncharacterized protein n=1 Tax=Caenorhabditis nigoni TaxID=1611254 RepID=A0A2G5SXR9_9PELO|nr:hypothetical protein B9Z55_025290 [Caenorhabditis nigoni]
MKHSKRLQQSQNPGKQNGKRKQNEQQNGKRKQNEQQEQPQESEQNNSVQIDYQKPVPTPPEEPNSELQQDQPEQPQEATSSILSELSNTTVPAS